jgi:hypothetical protein
VRGSGESGRKDLGMVAHRFWAKGEEGAHHRRLPAAVHGGQQGTTVWRAFSSRQCAWRGGRAPRRSREARGCVGRVREWTEKAGHEEVLPAADGEEADGGFGASCGGRRLEEVVSTVVDLGTQGRRPGGARRCMTPDGGKPRQQRRGACDRAADCDGEGKWDSFLATLGSRDDGVHGAARLQGGGDQGGWRQGQVADGRCKSAWAWRPGALSGQERTGTRAWQRSELDPARSGRKLGRDDASRRAVGVAAATVRMRRTQSDANAGVLALAPSTVARAGRIRLGGLGHSPSRPTVHAGRARFPFPLSKDFSKYSIDSNLQNEKLVLSEL